MLRYRRSRRADHRLCRSTGKKALCARRSLVLIDQRGTGDSEPRICPTIDRKLLDVTLSLGQRVAFPQQMLDVRPSTPVAGKHCRAGSIFKLWYSGYGG